MKGRTATILLIFGFLGIASSSSLHAQAAAGPMRPNSSPPQTQVPTEPEDRGTSYSQPADGGAFHDLAMPKGRNQVFGQGEWGRLPTPGVKVTLQEMSRKKDTEAHCKHAGCTLVSYMIAASGLLQGKTYRLWVKDSLRMTGPPFMTGFTADDSGGLICPAASGQTLTQDTVLALVTQPCIAGVKGIDITTQDYHRGEGLDVAVTSDDGAVHAYAEAVPFPIEASDNGCSVWVKPTQPIDESENIKPFTIFAIEGDGFEPNATISTFETISGLEPSRTKQSTRNDKTDKDGYLRDMLILYNKPGDFGGQTTETFTARSCKVAVDFDWGTVALKEVQ